MELPKEAVAQKPSVNSRTIVFAASAVVDRAWGNPIGKPITPTMAPQTHLVRARTDDTWSHKANSRDVFGHTRWLSDTAIAVEGATDAKFVMDATMRVRVLSADGGGGFVRRLNPKGRRRHAGRAAVDHMLGKM